LAVVHPVTTYLLPHLLAIKSINNSSPGGFSQLSVCWRQANRPWQVHHLQGTGNKRRTWASSKFEEGRSPVHKVDEGSESSGRRQAAISQVGSPGGLKVNYHLLLHLSVGRKSNKENNISIHP